MTGGAHGIGRAIAERFLREGASVVIADIEADAAAEAAAQLAELGKARAVAADVSSREDVRGAVELCVDEFGALDVLAANAANADVVPLMEIAELAWRRMIDVNLTGTFFSIQEAARVMISQMFCLSMARLRA